MKLLYNVHLMSDKVGRGDSYLILGDASCWRASRITHDVIEALPACGTAEGYIDVLKSMGSEDAAATLDFLRSRGVLRERKPIAKRVWEFLKDPIIPLVRGRLLRRIVNDAALPQLFNGQAMCAVFFLFVCLFAWLYIYPPIAHRPYAPLMWNCLTIAWILAGALAHELGHSLACARYGIGFRTIGLTWYFIWPVAFTNVSGVELLSRSQRIVVNLGGLYFQAVVTILFFALNIVWPGSGAGGAVTALNFLLILNLNPFIRSDAFWILQDGLLDRPCFGPGTIYNRIYQLLALGFTLFIAYYVGREMVRFVVSFLVERGAAAIGIKQVLSFAILSYVQILVIKGLYLRFKEIIGPREKPSKNHQKKPSDGADLREKSKSAPREKTSDGGNTSESD